MSKAGITAARRRKAGKFTSAERRALRVLKAGTVLA